MVHLSNTFAKILFLPPRGLTIISIGNTGSAKLSKTVIQVHINNCVFV